nr:tRNA uridine-5-carboxymethylaminomethyl(34) synthesis GTPase MnmE [Elusimicrobiota bacterium]
MNLDDTIAAVATPAGSGGLGVVRLSGPAALTIAARLFRGEPLDQAATHSLHHGTLRDGNIILDDAVAAVFRSPRSYTGEDVVELSCHGGSHILRGVLETCLRAGARLADPGEFTRRAFLNGKMDLAQAESVADLIAARSDSQHRLALNMLRGELGRAVQPARETLLHLLAHVEANLDFVEDEVPALT